jgi:DNA polymerase-1
MKRLGFFNRKEIESDEVKGGVFLTCTSCGLDKSCTNPKLGFTGKGSEKILLLGEINSPTDDRTATHWRGAGGGLLRKTLNEHGIDIDVDCWSLNVVRCYSKQATPHQIDCCQRFISETISELKPRIVIAFGRVALQALFDDFSITGEFATWRGFTIPNMKYNCWVCPTYPPKFIDNTKKQEQRLVWERDIRNALQLGKLRTFPKEQITYIDDLDVLRQLIKEGDTISIDFETTGLKPHAKGHEIVCASVSPNVNEAYAFEIPKKKSDLQPFLDILENPKILKMAHNMKYEHTWARTIWGIEIQGWTWDSMLAAHVIDNRRGVVGLKFQAFTMLGATDYSSEIFRYIRSNDKDSNSFNIVQELLTSPAGRRKLLKYCALDTIYQYRLSMLQKEMLQGKEIKAYKLFHDGILALSDAENVGMRIDLEVVSKAENYLNEQISMWQEKLHNTQFYKDFQKVNGVNANIDSNLQLSNYLYKYQKLQPTKLTTGGGGSVDDEALRNLNVPELNYILEIRRLVKARDTYLKSFSREQVNGIIHPNFNLHNVVSYRSSSDSPNFQNLPRRDKEIFNLVRGCIVPRSGHQFMEVDFDGIEVSIACAYHKDKNMIEYLLNPASDMHSDMAKQIFILDDFDKHRPEDKLLRQAAKNGFVFPQFYGDYYGNNALNLCQWMKLDENTWKENQGILLANGERISTHLRRHGIRSFKTFTSHMQEVERHFWTERFPDYGRWRERWYRQYLHKGYIHSYTGFKYTSEMRRNEVINYPVQGAAFHCLLWCFIRLSKEIKKRGWKTRLIGQIHDSMVLDVYPPERERICKLIKRITTVELAKEWTWINVPLSVTIEIGDVDGDWTTLKEIEN